MPRNAALILVLVAVAGLALAAGCATGPGGQPTPAVTIPPATNGSTGGTSTVALSLEARDYRFDTGTLAAPAGATVTLAFANRDAGVPHNFALYTDATPSNPIFQGALITGPASTTYTFTAPSTPGTYFFRCDPHPQTMTGSFIVT